MPSSSRLFQPLALGHGQLQHRIAMAPLTRFRAEAGHVPSPLHAEYYGQRASTPGTLLVTEATFITARAGGYDGAPGIWSREQIAAWKKVTAAVHAKGSLIFCQLWALGRVASPEVLKQDGGYDVVSASDIPEPGEGKTTPRPLTVAEIQEYVADYAQAAKNAIEAGFDGVEVHGANGYLLDQFWQDVTNQRTDAYGGSVENRARFGLEVLHAVIAALDGDSKKVALRLSPYGKFQGMGMADPHPQYNHIASAIAQLDLAYLSLVEERVGGMMADGSDDAAHDRTHQLDHIIERWGKTNPVLLAGGFTPVKAKRVLDEYYPDYNILATFGRFFISTPDLPAAIAQDVAPNAYDRSTFYGGGSAGYVDYPPAVKAKV